MAGAIDLAAVKARSEAAARAATTPAPAAGTAVVDITEASFQAEVLDRSFQVPVVIDLWAEWCGPCKQLSPILERLAGEANGAWILAKIDVEANPRISEALQVQSIPSVFAVLGGQLVPGFQGALPEAQVREFIAAVLQAGQEAGLPGAGAAPEPGPVEPGPADAADAPGVPEDPRLLAAEQALQDGDYSLAAERYQAILDVEPAHEDAALALRQVRLFERVESLDPAVSARAAAEPDDVDAQLGAADLEMARNAVDDALRRLLGALTRTGGDDRDRIRQRLLDYFELLGPDDARVAPARREMARSLF